MKSIIKKITAGLGLFAIIFSVNLLANPSASGHHSKGYHGDRQGMMTAKRILKYLAPLELDDSQKESIKQIIESGKEQSKPIRSVLKAQHKQLKVLSKEDNFDEQSIRETSQAIARLKADLMILRLSKKQEIRALLTDEQLSKLNEMKEKRRSMHE